MFHLVKGGAVIGILFFALVSFWPALDSEHKGPARVIDAETIEVDGFILCRVPPAFGARPYGIHTFFCRLDYDLLI